MISAIYVLPKLTSALNPYSVTSLVRTITVGNPRHPHFGILFTMIEYSRNEAGQCVQGEGRNIGKSEIEDIYPL